MKIIILTILSAIYLYIFFQLNYNLITDEWSNSKEFIEKIYKKYFWKPAKLTKGEEKELKKFIRK